MENSKETTFFVTQSDDNFSEIPRGISNSELNGNPSSQKLFREMARSIYGAARHQKEAAMMDADRRLNDKRNYFQKRMSASTLRRGDLNTRQIDLRDQMNKFEGFIRDNEAKRVRAMAKYQNEQYLCEVKSKEESELDAELEKVKNTYESLKTQVNDYKKYEKFLQQVIDRLPPDYIKIADNVIGGLIMRFNTLYETNLSLLKEMNEKSEHIREAHTLLISLREEHGIRILTLNSELSALYTTREKANEELHRNEQLFSNAHRELRIELSLFGTIIRSIDNLVGKCAWPYTASVGELTLNTKLQRIREYIMTIRSIINEIELNRNKQGSRYEHKYRISDADEKSNVGSIKSSTKTQQSS